MLFTRCPECATTFRVNDEALKKANGQVRCGRCASVFNALAERVADIQPASTPDNKEQAPTAAPAAAPAPKPAAAAKSAEPPTAVNPASAAAAPVPPPPRAAQPADPAAASMGVGSIADVVADAKRAEAEAAADPPTESAAAPSGDASGITAEQVEEVLAAFGDTPLLGTAPPWRRAAKRRASGRWTAAATLALLALGLQMVNHFRATLAGQPITGAWVQQAYDVFGVKVTPRWDVRQYEILDWVATAEPNTRGVGSLKISARVQNRGPLEQPYPQLQLRLKDRWEKAVGSRMFTSEEYLSRDAPHTRLMAAGETLRAEIDVVDPGPDAYGFELDVCIEMDAQRLTCRADKVFL